jgi:hypothetical protein
MTSMIERIYQYHEPSVFFILISRALHGITNILINYTSHPYVVRRQLALINKSTFAIDCTQFGAATESLQAVPPGSRKI